MNNPTHSRTAVAVAVACAVVGGGLMATQTRLNGQLGHELGDGYLAALISFSLGLVILGILVALLPKARQGTKVALEAFRTGRVPWWYAIGGALGAMVVLSQGLTAAILGVAIFTVATVTGQTISGLIVDRRGLGTMGRKPITPLRLVGAILTVVAVAIAVSPQIQGGVAWWALVLPLAAGLGAGWQQAIGGQLREISGSALASTIINFFVGAILLLLAFLVHLAIAGPPRPFPSEPVLYVGGMLGVIFIAAMTVIVRFTGVLLLGLSLVAGQLAASLALDLLLPVADHPIHPATILGTVLTFVAIVIASIRMPRRTRASAEPGTTRP